MVAMSEGGISVTSHSRLLIPSYQSQATSHQLLAPSPWSLQYPISNCLRQLSFSQRLVDLFCDRAAESFICDERRCAYPFSEGAAQPLLFSKQSVGNMRSFCSISVLILCSWGAVFCDNEKSCFRSFHILQPFCYLFISRKQTTCLHTKAKHSIYWLIHSRSVPSAHRTHPWIPDASGIFPDHGTRRPW